MWHKYHRFYLIGNSNDGRTTDVDVQLLRRRNWRWRGVSSRTVAEQQWTVRVELTGDYWASVVWALTTLLVAVPSGVWAGPVSGRVYTATGDRDAVGDKKKIAIAGPVRTYMVAWNIPGGCHRDYRTRRS